MPEKSVCEVKQGKRARQANALQEVRLTHSTKEVCENRWREGVSTT